MPFCAKCGAQLNEGASFCMSCGSPQGAAAGAGASTPVAGSTPITSNVAGALAYIVGFITGIVFLVIEPYKNDRFVRFHAFQSIFYSAFAIALSILWGVLSAALFAVSFGTFWHMIFLIWVVIRLGLFLVWLFLMYKAYNNERFMLPVLGELAAKQAG